MKLIQLALGLSLFTIGCFAHTTPVPLKEPTAAVEKKKQAEEVPEPEVTAQKVNCGDGKYCVPVFRFIGAVDDASVKKAITWMVAAQAAEPIAIVIEINTNGGGVDAGFHLIRAIEESPVPVVCVGDHKVMSQGFAILEACHWRSTTSRTQLMTHKPHLSGLESGSIEDLQNAIDSLKTMAHAHAVHCSRRLNITLEQYEEKVSGKKDWNMTPAEALSVGAIDAVVPSLGAVVLTLRTNGLGRKP